MFRLLDRSLIKVVQLLLRYVVKLTNFTEKTIGYFLQAVTFIFFCINSVFFGNCIAELLRGDKYSLSVGLGSAVFFLVSIYFQLSTLAYATAVLGKQKILSAVPREIETRLNRRLLVFVYTVVLMVSPCSIILIFLGSEEFLWITVSMFIVFGIPLISALIVLSLEYLFCVSSFPEKTST